MNTTEIIRKKRDGFELNRDEINFLVSGYTAKKIPDYQFSAFLMAVFNKGMVTAETAALTEAMLYSGIVVDLSAIQGVKVDKHSTGGVGDKTSLILAPVAAAAGVKVPMISGRGLGHTGGTLDKLEAIPGFRTDLSLEEYKNAIEKCGAVLIGQTKEIAPADKLIYSLRDVTATVESIPLITSSIMSKKLAEGIDGLVLDVKTGSGAFMRSKDDAEKLARKLVQISEKLGKICTAVITDMEQPLGEWVGNAAEVLEAIQVLKGCGPEDTRELCINLGGYMLAMSGLCKTYEEGFSVCEKSLDNGTALNKFRELVEAQGGNGLVCEEPEKILPSAKFVYKIKAEKTGYLSKLDALSVGEGLRALGGGRLRKEDTIDPAVAVKLCAKTGDPLNRGDTVIEIHYNSDDQLKSAMPYINSCWDVSDHADRRKLILERINH